MIVDLFIPCYVDQFAPQTAWNMIKILESLGCAVNYNHEQTCCGHPAFESGYWDDAKEVGEKFIKEFSNDRYIVCPSASCVEFIEKRYGEMFANSSSLNEYKALQKNLFEFSDFVVNVLKLSSIGAELNTKAALIDFCRCRPETKNAESLLQKVKGLELMKIENECCGFGGMFSTKYEPISVSMAEQLVQKVIDAGADTIISSEANCLMHLDAYIKSAKKPIKTMHLVDVLAEGWI